VTWVAPDGHDSSAMERFQQDMRVATIGYDPDHPGIEVSDFGSTEALNGYDALIWNPCRLLHEYHDAYTQPGNDDEAPLLSLAASNRLLADSRRRREDFKRLLDRGQVLVVNPPAGPYLRTHAIENILPFDPVETLPKGLRPELVTVDKPEVARFRGGYPFRTFAEAAGSRVSAHVAFVSFPGVPLYFGASNGAVFGGYIYSHPGHLLFLPFPAFDDRPATERWHAALLPLLERLEKQSFYIDLPSWCADYPVSGEREARHDLRALLAESERLKRKVDATRRKLHDIDRQKVLFAGEGALLVAAVAEAFQHLGASVFPGLLSSDSLILEYDDRFAVVLIVGRDGEADAAERLLALLGGFTAEFHESVRGIVVHVRARPPDQPGLVDEALRRQLLQRAQGYLTGWDLFQLTYQSPDRTAQLSKLFVALDGS